ncbi:MAG TPA: glycoside hydrolase [Allosphingosinicella sp.]
MNRRARSSVVAAAAIAALAACAAARGVPSRSASDRAAPAALGLDPFYARYVDAGGIPVIGSSRVPPEALAKARAIVLAMLAKRRDIRARIVRQGVRVAILAPDDAITDLPEHRDWKKPARYDPRLTTCELKNYALIEAATDRDYWNRRSRGSGGVLTAAGAENLLALPGDRYAGENILVHEFAHAILTAIEEADPKLYAEVERAYAHAVAAGKWKGDYAAVTVQEYWAEGTQYWFNDNRLARLDDAEIVSDGDLKRYDPQLWAALAKVYRGHRIAADPWYLHPARLNVPLGYKSADC